MEHHAAQQLDVEVAHAQLALADRARRGKHLWQRILEHILEVAYVLLLACPAQLAAALRAIALQLFLGRLSGRGVVADLLAQLDHPLADGLV